MIATSPTIMPLTPPRKVGLRSGPKSMSIATHTSRATAVATLVLTTAIAASAPAKYGSPPLKPFQPSHSSPAPAAAIGRLLGSGRARSRASRGPITAAATNPDVPAARWITYPPLKSSAPCWPHQPPPQIRKAFTAYANVDHSGTKISHTLKLIRPTTLPRNNSGVMPAKTNWK